MENMSALPLLGALVIMVFIIVLCLITWGIIKVIEKNQKKKRDTSLPEGETNHSDFADYLAEKYKEEL